MTNYILKAIEKFPKFLISTTALMAVFLGSGISKIEKQYDQKAWFRQGDKAIEEFDAFTKKYGSDTYLIVLLDFNESVFTKQNLKLVFDMTKDLGLLKNVIQTKSITNTPIANSKYEEIITTPFIEHYESTNWSNSYLEEKSNSFNQYEQLRDFYISPDKKSVAIYANIKAKPGHEVEMAKNVIEDFNQTILKKYKRPNVKIALTGSAAVGDAFEKESISDFSIILPLAFVCLSAILLLWFKSVSATLFSLLTILLTLVATIGIQGHLQIKLDLLTGMAPLIVVAICLSDIIHFVSYYQNQKENALAKSIKKNIFPTGLTTITTAFGFISFLTADLFPIAQMGLICSIGVVLAWLYCVFFLLPLIKLNPIRKKNQSNSPMDGERVTSVLYKHSVKITIVTITTSIVFILLAMQNRPNSNIQTYFSKKTEFRSAIEQFNEKIGGTNTVDIVLKTEHANGIKSPDFLIRVDEFQKDLKKLNGVTKTNSILSNIKEFYRLLDTADSKKNNIPSNKELIAQILLFIELDRTPENSLFKEISHDYKELRVSLFWKRSSSIEIQKGRKEIQTLLDKHNLTGNITGSLPLIAKLDKYIITSFISSMVLVMIITFIFMTIVFRSFTYGILSLIPNILAPSFGAATIYLTGRPFDVGCVLIFSISMGIAIDDTIFFLTNLKQAQKKKLSLYHCITETLSQSGKTLSMTTLLLVSIFSLFGLGSFTPNKNFALAICTTLIAALIIDLFFLPAMLFTLEKVKLSYQTVKLKVTTT